MVGALRGSFPLLQRRIRNGQIGPIKNGAMNLSISCQIKAIPQRNIFLKAHIGTSRARCHRFVEFRTQSSNGMAGELSYSYRVISVETPKA